MVISSSNNSHHSQGTAMAHQAMVVGKLWRWARSGSAGAGGFSDRVPRRGLALEGGEWRQEAGGAETLQTTDR